MFWGPVARITEVSRRVCDTDSLGSIGWRELAIGVGGRINRRGMIGVERGDSEGRSSPYRRRWTMMKSQRIKNGTQDEGGGCVCF